MTRLEHSQFLCIYERSYWSVVSQRSPPRRHARSVDSRGWRVLREAELRFAFQGCGPRLERVMAGSLNARWARATSFPIVLRS